MSKAFLIALNVVCWILGVGFVFVSHKLLGQVTPEGLFRTVLEWLAVGVGVTIFGGIPLALARNRRPPED